MKVLSQGNFPVRMKATGLKSVLMNSVYKETERERLHHPY